MKLWITVPPEGKIDPRIWLAEISEPDRPPDQIDSRQVDFSQIPRGKTVFSAPTIATYSMDMARLSVGELGELSVYQDSITELEIDYLEWDSLDFLRYFPNIRKAKINVRVKDIGALASLSQLRELSIMSLNGLSPRRLDCLGSLTSLETIYLTDWPRGAESIFCLSDLQDARLIRFPHPTLERLANWQALKTLYVSSHKLEDLKGLPASVEHLDLSRSPKVSSLSGLPAGSQLRKFDLEECRRIQSLDGLQHCLHLKNVFIRVTGAIDDLEPLRPLRELEQVYIADRTIIGPVRNIDALYNKPHLQNLAVARQSGLEPDRVLQVAPQCDVFLAAG